ncbi:glycosyltransferase [Microbacterium binotii]|uniref:glycosyltransferase n=1 Tax=Microbacterium binotii TaxID=462710 RepID=UPI001F1F9CBD|nr:glycosyltransferase [Microbacterium binotii]UIN31109.1 glycosyltransferase [Microbacterium binotii]
MNSAPWLSIITATYNAADTVAQLRDSIAAQSFRSFEWLVQDGGSSDETLQLLEEDRETTNLRVESEPDKGIYDAFNKAIQRATGQYVLFLGADDLLNDDLVLSDLHEAVAQSDRTPGLVLGTAVYPSGESMTSRLGWKTRILNTVHHQAVLYRRDLFRDFSYDISNRIIADYELNLIAHLTSLSTLQTTRVIAKCGDDGISRTTNEYQLYRDMHILRTRHISRLSSRMYWAIGIANVTRRAIGRRND